MFTTARHRKRAIKFTAVLFSSFSLIIGLMAFFAIQGSVTANAAAPIVDGNFTWSTNIVRDGTGQELLTPVS